MTLLYPCSNRGAACEREAGDALLSVQAQFKDYLASCPQSLLFIVSIKSLCVLAHARSQQQGDITFPNQPVMAALAQTSNAHALLLSCQPSMPQVLNSTVKFSRSLDSRKTMLGKHASSPKKTHLWRGRVAPFHHLQPQADVTCGREHAVQRHRRALTRSGRWRTCALS